MRTLGVVVSLFVFAVACGGDDGSPSPGTDAGGSMDAGADGGAGGGCSAASDCDDGVFCNGEETCDPASAEAGPNGCVPGDAAAVCDPGFVCDEATAGCVVEDCTDADPDGDGVDSAACGGTDCDDTDANRYPGNTEVCDAADLDEDCDITTFGSRDMDMDTYIDAACCNESNCGDDCDDSIATVHPTEAEVCDGLDNDCDSSLDEGVLQTYYLDNDRDMYGQDGVMMQACAPVGMYSTMMAGDCDDALPGVNPAAPEVCDGLDNDCDGMLDEGVLTTYYLDADGDGRGVTGMSMMLCAPAGNYRVTLDGDCDDSDAANFPGNREICDGQDNDCTMGTWGPGEDDDRDDYADASCGGNDCDDRDRTINPGATELCDGIDSNCSGDNEDSDRDRYSPPTAMCTGGPFPKTDCEDRLAIVNPGQRSYFETPYCVGSVACPSPGAGGTTWTCRLPSPLPCRGAIVSPGPSWDYDCSGRQEPEPAFTASCNPAALCLVPLPPATHFCNDEGLGGQCGGFGPLYTGRAPGCGQPVDFGACCCPALTCTRQLIRSPPLAPTHYMPCR